MSLVNFSNLDFDQIRSTIKDYLRANSNFTDYDFEGSNLSVLIDALAYNTYITSYNANMVTNEVFIDSATLRENIVALARNIGYTPRSRVSPRANVTFLVDATSLGNRPISITLKKGLVCTSTNSFSAESFTFCVPDDITVPVVNNVAIFDDIIIYEGILINESFRVDSLNKNQRFILNNVNIDTSTINIFVRNTATSSTGNKFRIVNNLFEAKPQENICFIQEIEDQRYELIFGDGVFGKKLSNNNIIDISYIVTNGRAANGVTNFTFSGRLFDNNDNIVTNSVSLVATNIPAQSGEEIESVNTIRKYATKLYASQNRAVTPNDYEAIVPYIYPEAETVTVFGGEDLNPPEYGKVFLAIKPKYGNFVPATVKLNLKKALKKFAVAGIIPEIVDMKFLYVEIISKVYYDTNRASSANDIKTQIINTLNQYADSAELNKYGARFKYSKVQKVIDDSHPAITSNITTVQMRRDLSPAIGKIAEYEICFGNEIQILDENGYNIKSSGFSVEGIAGTVYLVDVPNDDGVTGSISLVNLNGKSSILVAKSKAGTIDYVRGEIMLNPLKIIGTQKSNSQQGIIEIAAIPASNDVIGLQDLYLQFDITNSEVDMVIDNMTSGDDTSGKSYIKSSSYFNGDIAR